MSFSCWNVCHIRHVSGGNTSRNMYCSYTMSEHLLERPILTCTTTYSAGGTSRRSSTTPCTYRRKWDEAACHACSGSTQTKARMDRSARCGMRARRGILPASKSFCGSCGFLLSPPCVPPCEASCVAGLQTNTSQVASCYSALLFWHTDTLTHVVVACACACLFLHR